MHKYLYFLYLLTYLISISEYKETTCCRVTSHLNCIYDIVWSHDGEHIFTACGDGSIGYHQIEAGTSYLSNENIKFLTCNSSSMKSVVVHPENPSKSFEMDGI